MPLEPLSGRHMIFKKFNKVSLYGAGILVALVILTIIFVNSHISNTTESVRAFVETTASEDANLANQKLATMLERLRITAEISDMGIKGLLDENQDAMATYLSALAAESSADDVSFVDADGKVLIKDGSTKNLQDLEYSGELDGETGKYIYVKDDGITGNSAVVYVHPVTVGGKTNYLLLYLADATLYKAFIVNDLHGRSFFAIVDKDMDVLYANGGEVSSKLLSGSLWTNMQNGAENTSKWILFSQKQRERQSSSIYCVTGKELRFCCMDPLSNTDWYTITGVNSNYIEKAVKQVCTHGTSLKVEVYVIMLLILAVYFTVVIILANTSEEKSKELEGKADTDLLTGLSNKISTENKIKEYLEWNPHSQGVMILIDVDNFKKINDTMGHAFGDEVLRNLGTRLRSLYRMSDIVGRLGGDEFVVFLKDIRDEDVIRRESHKLEIFFHGFEVGEYVKYSVTASLGAVVFPADGDVFEELYQNADKALYTAKKAGKNRLVFYRDRNKTAEELDQITAEFEAKMGLATSEQVAETTENTTESAETAEVNASETLVQTTDSPETEVKEAEATVAEAVAETEEVAEAPVVEETTEAEEVAEAPVAVETAEVEEVVETPARTGKIIFRKKKKADNGEVIYVRENVIRMDDGSIVKITAESINLADGEKLIVRKKTTVDERDYRVVTRERVIKQADGAVREIESSDIK